MTYEKDAFDLVSRQMAEDQAAWPHLDRDGSYGPSHARTQQEKIDAQRPTWEEEPVLYHATSCLICKSSWYVVLLSTPDLAVTGKLLISTTHVFDIDFSGSRGQVSQVEGRNWAVRGRCQRHAWKGQPGAQRTEANPYEEPLLCDQLLQHFRERLAKFGPWLLFFSDI